VVGNEAVEEWKSMRVKKDHANDRKRLRPGRPELQDAAWTFLSLNSSERRDSSHKNRVRGNNASVRGHRSNNRFQDIEIVRTRGPAVLDP
jgi:hypothetical protein